MFSISSGRFKTRSFRFWCQVAAFALVIVVFSLGFAGKAQASAAKYGLHNQNRDWMRYLPDTMQISQINLPGTHDSGTFGVAAVMKGGAKATYNSIPEQLNAGIRFFDIRLFKSQYIGADTDEEQLGLCHGPSTCYTTEHGWTILTLDHVFTYASDFVKNHPTEVVVLEIRRESGTFHEDQIMERINRIMKNYHHGHKEARWPYIQCYNSKETVPTLGESRGKVIVICEDQTPYPATYYEDHYEWYEPKNISPKVKSEYIASHLNNYTYAQEYFSTEDKFVDTGARNQKGVKPASIKAPMCINTNLTQIEGPGSSLKKGPYECWYPLYHGSSSGDYTPMKNMMLNLKVDNGNQRTGWWRFDYPQDEQVTEIIESNYIYLKEYCIFIKEVDKDFKASDVSVDVVLSNGYHLKPVRTSFQDGGYMIDFGYYPDSVELKDIQVKSNNAKKGIYFENNYINKTGHHGLEYFPIAEYRKDNYRMGNLDGTQTKDVFITFEDAAHPEYRPGTTPQEILTKLGDLSFYWDEGTSGQTRRYMQVSKAGSAAGQLTSVRLFRNVPNTYILTVTLPLFSSSATRITPIFNSLPNIPDSSPYMIKSFKQNTVTLKLKTDEDKIWYELPMSWIDGNDYFGYRGKQKEKLLSSAVEVHHKAYDRVTGKLVIDEYLQGGGKNPVLKFNENDKLEAYVNGYGSDFRPLRHYFEFSSNAEYYNYKIKSTPETYFTQQIQFIWAAEVQINLTWKDNSDAAKVRPAKVPILVRDNDSGIVISDEMNQKDGRGNIWSKAFYCQYFSDENDNTKTLSFKNISYDIQADNYQIDSVVCAYSKISGGIPIFALNIACSYQAPDEYEDIHGSITWYDINDKVSHRDLNPAITVYRNEDVLTLEHSGLYIDSERTSYYYEPDSDFPLLSKDKKTSYTYTIDPQPLPGYLVLRPDKFDITYIRAINVSGTVKWSGKRPVASDPIVTLRDQNGTMIDRCTCTDGTYLFENLPIATDGKRCEYHIEVTVPGAEDCLVNYSAVQQDGKTGNITQNATLRVPEQPVSAEIPVELILNGVDSIKDVTDEFVFVLIDDNPDSGPKYLTLNSANSFSGSFLIEKITDSIKRTYTVKQINIGQNPDWIYDDSTKTATVSLRFISGGKPVAEVDMGGDTALTFSNTYTGDIEKKNITVNVQWLDAEKHERTVPDSVEITLFSDGKAAQTAEVSAATGWTCVFSDLPSHDVIPSNDGSRRLAEIRYSVDGSDVTDFVRTVEETDTDQYLMTYKANPDLTTVDIDVDLEWIFIDMMSKDPDMPADVTVTLYADGKVYRTAKVTEAGNWACTFNEVPLKDIETGKRISYAVDAEDVDGFTYSVCTAGSNRFSVTYRAKVNIETTDIYVRVEWNDPDMLNASQIPESVSVTLYEDSRIKYVEEIGEDQDWTRVYKDMPVNHPATGEPLTYAVDGADVQGYTRAVRTEGTNSFVISYYAKPDIKTTDVNIRVEWFDPDMTKLQGAMPDAVTVTLYKDGEISDTAKVTAGGNWTFAFKDLPVNHPATGMPLTYAVDAEDVQGYTRAVRTEGTNNFVISYYEQPVIKTTDVNVRVEWYDPDMTKLQGSMPENVTVTLYKNGQASDYARVTASDNWAMAFKDLPVNHPATGEPLTYAVDGADVQGYTRAVRTEGTNSFVISYYAKPDIKTTDVNVRVEWNDPDMTTPQGSVPDAVTVTLYKNGEVSDNAKVTASGNWTAAFKDLPVSHPATGEPLTYAVDAEDVPGYTRSVRTEGTNNFVIAYYALPDIQTVNVNVRVEWNDPDMKRLLGARPDAVTVTLYRNGQLADSANAAASGNWALVFKDLPVNHPATGEPLTYAVDGADVQGYTRTVRTEGVNSFVIAYYAQPDIKTTDVNVRVEWFDPDMTKLQGAMPDAVTVTLYKDGEVSDTAKVTASGSWACAFKKLPVSHPATGEPLTYAVDAEDVEGYTRAVRTEGTNNFVIAYYAQPDIKTTDINVRVEWFDPDMTKLQGAIPGAVTVTLYRDGQASGSVDVSASEDWAYTFRNQPVNHPATGEPLTYAVDGENVEGYNRTVRNEGSYGFVISYYAAPVVKTTDITIRVEWFDPTMLRMTQQPDSVNVILYADSVKRAEAPVGETNNWSFTFKNMPVNNSATGAPIVYSADGTDVPGYTRTVRMEGTGRYVVAYYAVPDIKTTDINVRVEWVWPDMDQTAKIPDHISVTLYGDQKISAVANTDEAKNWACVFRDKPVNDPATGMPVSYTVIGSQIEGFTQDVRNEGTYGFVITYRAGKAQYRIIQGAHQTITTIDDTATFASDAPYGKFVSVIVDGSTVPKQYYTSHSGSTVVVFNKKFIQSLKPGKHELTIVSFDGSASTDFNLIKLSPTGDSFNLALLAVLLFASTGVLVVCLRKRGARR